MNCPRLSPATFVFASFLLCGCAGSQSGSRASSDQPESEPRPSTLKDEAREVLGKGQSAASDSKQRLWTIILRTCGGPDQETVSANALNTVRTDAGVPEAYAEKRGNNTVIAFGRYPGPDDPRAKADLARLRDLTIGSAKPFPGAFLAPPAGEALAGTVPEFDLRNTKKLFGDSEAVYTLQIGIYCRMDERTPSDADIAEFRKAAEKAVATLRNDGELAFYYHGPYRSTVTVGVFSHDDYKPYDDNPSESPLLAELRQRHRYSLLNGAAYKQKLPDGRTASEPVKSALVKIPAH